VDACLEASAGESIVSDLRGFLEARGVPADDVAAILDAPQRIGVYRTLVRSGLLSVVSRLMPRTRARMNAVCNARFDADFARFLDERAPQTHYLRDVPSEFFAWAKPLWEGDVNVRSYLVDLAAHELTCFELATARAPPVPPPVAEIDLLKPAVLLATMRLVRGLRKRFCRPRAARRCPGRIPRRRGRHTLARADATCRGHRRSTHRGRLARGGRRAGLRGAGSGGRPQRGRAPSGRSRGKGHPSRERSVMTFR
jgi:hypothetical protein